MSILIECVLEFILEMGIECSTDPTTPPRLRKGAVVLLSLIGAVFLVFMLVFAAGQWHNGDIAAAIIFGLLGLGLPAAIFGIVRAKYRKNIMKRN